MNITGLDMVQISRLMAVHVENHVKGFKLSDGDSLFQESYLLHYDEVEASIPEQHRHRFNSADKFNGASGFIEADSQEHFVMLLISEDYTTAYLLSMQGSDLEGNEQAVIIGDFL